MGLLDRTEKKARETDGLNSLWSTNSVKAVELALQSTNEKIQSIENDLRTKVLTNSQKDEYIRALNALKEAKLKIEKAKKSGDYFSLLNYEDANLLKKNLSGDRGFFRNDYNEKDLSVEKLYSEFTKNITGKTGQKEKVTRSTTTGHQSTSDENEIYRLSDIIGKSVPIQESEVEEPTPTPQAQPQQAPSTRLTTATTPAEFKPALMEKEKAKTEEEYLGKDRSKWVNMSTADKVAGLAGLLGDAGGDIVDIVAAAQGIENGGAERLKKRRDEINQRREERKREYQEYLNRVDDINRQIAMHNNNTINNSAMAKFNADNAYRMMDYQARQQAAAQAAAGLYM